MKLNAGTNAAGKSFHSTKEVSKVCRDPTSYVRRRGFHSTKEVSKAREAADSPSTFMGFHSTKEVSKGARREDHGLGAKRVSIPLRKFPRTAYP